MNFKEHLLQQFTVCFDENGWFVALHNALDGVTSAQAAWKPAGTQNSIGETLSHLNFYNYAYVERFKGKTYEYPVDDNDATFAAGGGDAEWAAEVTRFNAVMTEFRELIRNADDAKFDLPVSDTNQAKWGTLISNINAHNAYHGGQIMLLRKLQDAWDSSKGVS